MTVASLHEFMASRHAELLAMSLDKLRELSSERTHEELAVDMGLIISEITAALQHAAGLPVQSSLPGRSEVARNYGEKRQRSGSDIAHLALEFGAISNSLGELGASQGLSFSAQEYRVFNQCLDSAVASALEQFSYVDQRQQDDGVTARLGFFAHELRNALSSARTAMEFLKGGELGMKSRTGQVLERALRRLESLVGQTLLSVQVRAGLEPSRKRLNLVTVFQQLEQDAVRERGISIRIEADESVELDADEQLLLSAMSNLLQNAFKFTRAGGCVVLRGRREGMDVVLEVEDECGGLAPGTQEELFRPWVRRDADRRGLGLGLAITREAVEMQGGEVYVQNLPGKGCVFGVRLRAQVT
jgi:signal transduction histidine kinase